jgi:hypothetical protein
MARAICALLMGFPVFFFACTAAILMLPGAPRDEPVLVGVFAILALVLTPAAPIVRERIARAGIVVAIDNDKPWRVHRPVYSTFAAATIASFLVAQAPALFGFMASALTRDLTPLSVGSACSYLVWLILWPQRRRWSRWTLQAMIVRTPVIAEDTEPEAAS